MARLYALKSFGLRCTYAGDITTGQDALACDSFGGVPIITNPPWRRDQLHALIPHFMRCAPFCWLLFDANWAHTRQSRDLIQHCSRILPIGRVRWIPGSPYTGKDDASWYRFEQAHKAGPVLLPFRCDNRTNHTRPCQQCRKPYRVRRADTRFCSNACRQHAYRDRLVVTVSVTEASKQHSVVAPGTLFAPEPWSAANGCRRRSGKRLYLRLLPSGGVMLGAFGAAEDVRPPAGPNGGS